jgi:hypothetical protein
MFFFFFFFFFLGGGGGGGGRGVSNSNYNKLIMVLSSHIWNGNIYGTYMLYSV